MRTLIICHAEDRISTQIMIPWLAQFSDLRGVVLIDEPKIAKWRRLRNEVRRSGLLGFLDVMLFRIFYRFFVADKDQFWMNKVVCTIPKAFNNASKNISFFKTESPNSDACGDFIKQHDIDVTLALCKVILRSDIYSLASTGTFVLHPGICPEYRNAHGCFWALANRDLNRVGMTLLKIDDGVDTGPVYGYFRYPFDEVNESHVIIQYRMTLDNLQAIAGKLQEIHLGTASPIDTTGRTSNIWGQPTYSAYRRWKKAARRDAGKAVVL